MLPSKDDAEGSRTRCGVSCDTPARNNMTNKKPTTFAFLLYSLMINNRGKQPSEHEEQIHRKKCLQVTL
jgi:hypothetical protein